MTTQLPMTFPVVPSFVEIPKPALVEHCDRLFKEGRRDAALGFLTQAGAFKDNESVPIARSLAKRYGMVSE